MSSRRVILAALVGFGVAAIASGGGVRDRTSHARHAATVAHRAADPEPAPIETPFGAARRAFGAASCGALAEPNASIRERSDVPYATLGGRTLRFDLARPAGDDAAPAVVLVHGGGFREGDKRDLAPLMRALATRGYAAVSVEYRLLVRGEARFPAGITDVRCAVRYLGAHAAELGIDAERMAAIGFSAGGHLVSSMAWQADVGELDRECPHAGPLALDGVVAFYPPLDFRPEVPWGPTVRFLLRRVLDDGRHSLTDLVRLASPVAFADRRDPPVLVVHGTADRVIPIERSREAVRQARRAGAMADLLEASGLAHGFGVDRARPRSAPVCATLAFLDATLAERADRGP